MSGNTGEFSKIASTVELAGGLSLILVAGPDCRAQEGLQRIRTHLSAERPTLWHRLDLQGPDLVTAVERTGMREPILLVHGLENLDQGERAAVESSLNLLRDRLVRIEAAVILWIPQSDLESFQLHCADLFAWRSLLVTLSREQVPVEAEVEARRLYLAAVRKHMRASLEKDFLLDLLYDKYVVLPGNQETVPLEQWAREVQCGVLTGAQKRGKSTALKALALRWATDGLANKPGTPCPLLLEPWGFYPEYYLLPPELNHPGYDTLNTGLNTWFRRWADSGELVLLLDDFLESANPDRSIDWLATIKLIQPRLRVVVASEPESLKGEIASWERVELMWPSLSQLQERVHRLAQEDPSQRWRLETLGFILRSLELMPPATQPPPFFHLISQFVRHAINELERPGLEHAAPDLADFLDGVFEYALADHYHAAAWFSDSWAKRVCGRLSLRNMSIKHAQGDFSIRDLEELIHFDSLEYSEPYNKHRLTTFLSILVRQGLFESCKDCLRFSHPLLQEFFAASLLASKGAMSAALTAHPHLERPEWQTVVALAASIFARSRHSEAQSFLGELLRALPPSDPVGMQRLATVLEASRTAQLSSQETEVWRSEARQLCEPSGGSEQERQARAQLSTALERLESCCLSNSEPA
jgi:hypothetical protein